MEQLHIVNFGCRATQADGAALERAFVERGYTLAEEEAATVVVLNTCTVTAAADADARAAIRRVHRKNPTAQILVTGCYAQRAPEELRALPGVTWVVGNSHKSEIPAIASRKLDRSTFVPLEDVGSAVDDASEVWVGDIFADTDVLAAPVFEGGQSQSGYSHRTRANLKVQDGCNNRCSFCVIPFVRGKSRSLAADKVISEAEQLVRAGFRELVLSGINLGRWGRDLERRDRFANLLRYLLKRSSVEKLRISSVEPMDWTDELIELVATEPRIAKHAHLPLQSGSDAILRRMHRKYRPWHYEEKVNKIRRSLPTAAIGADVMVGFPRETETYFRETYEFIERLPLTYLHVFTFSARPGTPAATMSEQVPTHVARERNRVLRELIARKNHAHREGLVGLRLQCLTLSRDAGLGTTEALSDNFLKVQIEGQHEPNEWHQVQVQGLIPEGLIGVSVKSMSSRA